MGKSALATFIIAITLVAATMTAACSPDRPSANTSTAVPSDMPGARGSGNLNSASDAITIMQPLPGAVVTNTVTVLASGPASAGDIHVRLTANGDYLAESTVTPAGAKGPVGVFSTTLQFEPVSIASDGEVTVSRTADGNNTVEQKVSVHVRLAPANARAISGPVINLSPDNGKAGTPVVVVGDGFPSDRMVEIRLSGVNTEATEHAYVSTRTGPNGELKVSFTMPAYWPSGDPIVAPQVLVVASTPDFVSKAIAIFNYSTGTAPEARTPLPGEKPAAVMAEAFLRAWASGSPADTLSYLSTDFRSRVAADGGAEAGIARAMGVQGVPSRSSVAVVASSADETIVRATLQTDTGVARADLTLQEAADGWKIVWIAPAVSEVQ